MTRLIRQGGLYRCCLETLAGLPVDREDTEGELLNCRFCAEPMVFKGGGWEWARAGEDDEGEWDK